MIKSFISIAFLVFTFAYRTSSQEPNNLNTAFAILRDARNAIGLDWEKSNLRGLHLTQREVTETTNISREFWVSSPDKLYATFALVPSSKTINIWNGEKYRRNYEMNLNGKVIRKSMLDAIDAANSKKSAPDSEDIKKRNEYLMNLWVHVFPYTLNPSFEPEAKFVYIGKAEAKNGISANVIDVKSALTSKIRLFFDEKSKFLLMMWVTSDLKDGLNYQTRTYYNDFRLKNGAMLPSAIQSEGLEIDQSGAISKKYVTDFIFIDEFQLNPKIDESLFDAD
ncbi:MAG: hypothetical protein ACK5NT_16035 [Pyrinomonadaceae bacterium]